MRGRQKVKSPITYLDYKQVTVTHGWGAHTHSLLLDTVTISTEGHITVADQTVKALVVTWCTQHMQPLHDLHIDVFISVDAQSWKVLLQFGEQMIVQWCQITTTGMLGKNLPVPSTQEFHCVASNIWLGIVPQQQYCLWQKSRFLVAYSAIKFSQCALIITSICCCTTSSKHTKITPAKTITITLSLFNCLH